MLWRKSHSRKNNFHGLCRLYAVAKRLQLHLKYVIIKHNIKYDKQLRGVFMLKIATAQFRVIPGHPSENTDKMLAMIAEAKAQGANLIIFPEMSLPGYFLGDTW